MTVRNVRTGRGLNPRSSQRRLRLLSLFAAAPFLAAAGLPLHTALERSIPDANSVLEMATDRIVLDFTTPVDAALSRITVRGPGGTPVETGPVEYTEAGEDQIRVVFASPTAPGPYQVDWQALAPDGHVVTGTFVFLVSAPAQAQPAPGGGAGAPGAGQTEVAGSPQTDPVAAEPALSRTMDVGTRWLQLIGAALFLGIAGIRFDVLRVLGRAGALPEVRTRIRGGIWRFGWFATFLLLVALPLRLWNQTVALGGELDTSQLSHLLFQTGWGAGWWLHLTVLVLGTIGLTLASPRGLGERGWGIFAGAAVLLPLVPALQGHAWGAEGGRALAATSLYFHVAGAGLWLGGLILLVAVGMPAVRATPPAPEELGDEPSVLPTLARLVNAFSRLALLSVALVLLTGAINAWMNVGTIGNLLGSAYGRTLLLKLAVVAGALMLGFYNWRKVRPALAKRPDPGALRIPATVEAALGIGVLLVTAFLVSTAAP
ncbi:MAG: CopD family protein [Gemmatimonadota bacterium]